MNRNLKCFIIKARDVLSIKAIVLKLYYY